MWIIVLLQFDKPLFQKAFEIVKSCGDEDIKEIIIRLGGFHTLMSYLDSIGYIMAGSGLKEVLSFGMLLIL